MPKISVCIPTYNYGRFVGAAIESVLAQSRSDFEVIVSDNASTDQTRSVVEALACRDRRIRYLCNDRNLGMVANWNRCLELAGREYVKFLCADDLLEPGALERLARLLDEHPQAVLAAGARRVIVEGGEGERVLAYARQTIVVPGRVAIRRCIARGNLIGEPSAVLFRRAAVTGGFDANYPQVTDFEMWLRLLERGDFVFTPEIVCTFRHHAEQETRKNLRANLAFADEFRLCRAYADKVPKIDLWQGLLRRRLAMWATGRFSEAG